MTISLVIYTYITVKVVISQTFCIDKLLAKIDELNFISLF